MIATFVLLLMQAVSIPAVVGPTDTWVVAVFPKGTTDPRASKPLTILKTLVPADITCDQNPSPRLMTSDLIALAPTVQLQFDDPDRPGRYCVTTPRDVLATDVLQPISLRVGVPKLPLCAADPCPQYEVFLQAQNGFGTAWSAAATPSFSLRALEPDPPVIRPECVPPLGRLAVSIVPTLVSLWNGRAGARAIQGFQLASPNSPITLVAIRIDGVLLEPVAHGDDLTAMPGWWITMPPAGRHTISIQANNLAGCTREVAAAPLVVP